jgi:citrate lyase beta subunit
LPERRFLRSYLFAPGSDEHKLRKAVASGSDAVVFDLEDSVAPHEKEQARETVSRVVHSLAETAGTEIHIRVNRAGGVVDRSDIAAAVVPGVTGVRLPKVDDVADIEDVDGMIGELEAERGISEGTLRLYPTIESPAGVLASADLGKASDRIAALVFGPADFAAAIGVQDPSFEATLFARSMIVSASSAAGIGRPIDGAFLDIEDLDGLRLHCERVRQLGFEGKSAIHPRQLPVIHEAFRPTMEEIERARLVMAAVAEERTTGMFSGVYVDPPVIAQARAVLELLARIESKG